MLTPEEIREIEDIVANNVISMAYLWSRKVKREKNVTMALVRDLYRHVEPLHACLRRYASEALIISPTGHGVRGMDLHGSGAYHAPRKGARLHGGLDFCSLPGQVVVSPINGRVIREARPYVTGELSGVLIEGKHVSVKLFYLLPDAAPYGREITQGERIGIAQSLQGRYPGITNHIHLEITSIDPEVLL